MDSQELDFKNLGFVGSAQVQKPTKNKEEEKLNERNRNKIFRCRRCWN